MTFFHRNSFWFLTVIFTVAMIINSCNVSFPSYTRSGEARDTLFSYEHRGNNVTVIWLTHDDVSAYCFVDSSLRERIPDLLHNHEGEVIIGYKSPTSPLPETEKPCYNTEFSTTVYIATNIQPVSHRK